MSKTCFCGLWICKTYSDIWGFLNLLPKKRRVWFLLKSVFFQVFQEARPPGVCPTVGHLQGSMAGPRPGECPLPKWVAPLPLWPFLPASGRSTRHLPAKSTTTTTAPKQAFGRNPKSSTSGKNGKIWLRGKITFYCRLGEAQLLNKCVQLFNKTQLLEILGCR